MVGVGGLEESYEVCILMVSLFVLVLFWVLRVGYIVGGDYDFVFM